jgi:hypothetical protein
VLNEDEEDATANGYTIGANAGSNKTEKTTGGRTGLVIKITGTKAEGAVTITKTGQGALFTVAGQAGEVPHLILENITLKGDASNNKPLIIAGNAGTTKGKLTMKENSRITGNTSSATAAGVQVKTKSEFLMEGGSIDNNTSTVSNTTNANQGGAVYVASEAIFTMSGGVITKNIAASGAAVFIDWTSNKYGIFTKSESGGIIYGSKSDIGDDGNRSASASTQSKAAAIVSVKNTNITVNKYRTNSVNNTDKLSIASSGGIAGTWQS